MNTPTASSEALPLKSNRSQRRAAKLKLECVVGEAVKEYIASTGRVVESVDVTAEGVRARTRDRNEIDIAMGWA